MKQAITIVGARGDLGNKLTNQALEKGFMVVEIDIHEGIRTNECINPVLLRTVARTSKLSASVPALLSGIVHWCAPLSSLATSNVQFSDNTVLILHDSVMCHSDSARMHLQGDSAVAIVHVTTNAHNTVFISDSSDNIETITSHIEQLGLQPVLISPAEHDMVMAKSQGLIALLCTQLQGDLESLSAKGFLTPSGDALLDAFRDRSAAWTHNTLHSITHNPQSAKLLANLVKKLQTAGVQ